MIVAGIFLVIICIFLLALIHSCKEDNNMLSVAFASIGLLFGIILIIAWILRYEPQEVSSKDNLVKVEIRQSVVDGKIISTDTIYVFTPKKK